VRPGAIVLVKPGSTVQEVADDLAFPNGMAVTPDNATLIIAESWRGCLTAFDIATDGTLSRRRVWAKCGAPDGICLDSEGACWFADVGAKRCVRVAEGGRVLDKVTLDRGAFACVLGGPDRRTLYITAAEWFGMDRMAEMAGTGQVLAAPAPASGAGWP
jgi:sugar lactone lactonase YvrE